MSSVFYQLINPPIRALLRSPCHWLVSSNTLLLEFTGRKSGRALATPISYFLDGQTAHCFTKKSFNWWRNLTTGRKVRLTVRGRVWESTPLVEHNDRELMADKLDAFLRAVPRDAGPSGVSMDRDGVPNPEDIRRAVQEMVYLQFPLAATQEAGHG